MFKITERHVNFFLKIAMVTSVLELLITNYLQYRMAPIIYATELAIKHQNWKAYFHWLHLFWLGAFIVSIFNVIIIMGAIKKRPIVLLLYIWATSYYMLGNFKDFLGHFTHWEGIYTQNNLMTGIPSLNMLAGLLALMVWLIWLSRHKNNRASLAQIKPGI